MRQTCCASLVAFALWVVVTSVHAGPGEAPRRLDLPERLLVIGHRGACGYRPEHTLASYALAIRQGADFIEPDLVATRDGHLIARHENVLDQSTNIVSMVRDHGFPDRKATKRLDGVEITGYFSEDYTLAEIKRLRARERIPRLRPDNVRFDDKFEIPTLVEVIELVRKVERETGKKIGIYPETKHPTYFREAGIDLGRTLVETLVREKFTDPTRVYIQSFEVANLIELQRTVFPKHRIDLPLVQLLGDVDDGFVQPESSFSRPFDFVANGDKSEAELRRIYGGLVDLVEIKPTTGYGALTEPRVLQYMATHYAEGLGPWISSFVRRKREGEAGPRLTGEIRSFVREAIAAGLEVHPYTLRAEEPFLARYPDGRRQNMVDAGLQLLELGATGYFTDHPDLGCMARRLFESRVNPHGE